MFIMKFEKNDQKFNGILGIVGLLSSAYLIMKAGEDKGFSNGIVTGRLHERKCQDEDEIIVDYEDVIIEEEA